MKLDKRFKADRKVTVLFFSVMIAGISLSVANRSKEKKIHPDPSPDLKWEETLPVAAFESARPAGVDFPTHDTWGRDPFLPPPPPARGNGTGNAKTRSAPRLVLTAILIDREVEAAVINGEVYRKGQRIHSYTVERISRGHVTLSKGPEKIILKI